MAQFTDEQLQRKIQEGFIVESEADMTETYKKALIGQLTVQGDTELMSAPAYYMAAKDAPSTNTMVSATAIIQDEMGHANIAYRLLQENPNPTEEEIRYGMAGNICRCTGYIKIFEAIEAQGGSVEQI